MSPAKTVVTELDPDFETRIACANPCCQGGGLDPLPVVRELIDERRGVLRVESCGGRQWRPDGTPGARCDTMFCIRLDDDPDD